MNNSFLLGMLLLFSIATNAQQAPATATTTTQTQTDSLFAHDGSTLFVSVERNKTLYPLSQIPKLHAGDVLVVDLPWDFDRDSILGVAFIPKPGQKISSDFKKLSDGISNLRFPVTNPDAKLLFFIAPSISWYDRSIGMVKDAIETNAAQLRKSATDLAEMSKTASAIDQLLSNMMTAQRASTRADALKTVGQDFGYTVSSKCISQDAISRKCAVTDFLANVKPDKLGNLNKAAIDAFINYLPSGAASTAQLVAAAIYFFQANSSDYEYLSSIGYVSPDSTTRSKVELMLSRAPTLKGKTVSVQVWGPAFEDNETTPTLAFTSPAICIAGNLEIADKSTATSIFSKPYGTGWALKLYSETNKSIGTYELLPNPASNAFVVKNINGTLPNLASWSGKRLRGEVSFKWAAEDIAPIPVLVVIPDTASKLAASLKPALAVAGEAITLSFDSPAAPCLQSLALANSPQPVQAKIVTSIDNASATFDDSALPAGSQTLILNVAGIPATALIPLVVASKTPAIADILAYSADSSIKVQGVRLNRIASITVDQQKFIPVDGSWKLSGAAPDSAETMELRASGAIGPPATKTAMLAFTGDNPAPKPIPVVVRNPRPVAKVVSSSIIVRDPSLANWGVWTWVGATSPLLPLSASALVDFSPDQPTTAFSTKARLVLQPPDSTDQIEITPDFVSTNKLRARVFLPSTVKSSFNGGGNYSYFIRDNNIDGPPRALPFTFVRLPVVSSPATCDATGTYSVTVSDPYLVDSIGTSESNLLPLDFCTNQNSCLRVAGTISGKLFSKVVDAPDQVLPISIFAPASCVLQSAKQ